jgi:hypothetical protein
MLLFCFAIHISVHATSNVTFVLLDICAKHSYAIANT